MIELNRDGAAPILFVCDHASRIFPTSLGRLDLSPEILDLHVAYDIGAAAVTRQLSETFDAPALLAGYSRLVIDLNRGLDQPTLIPEYSDGIAIPGNHGLSEAGRAARIKALYHPWHRTVAARLHRMETSGGPAPVLIGLHSFTPVMAGLKRPWQVGVLWDGDGTLPRPLMAALAAGGEIHVGDNMPYSARNPSGGTLETHALDVNRSGFSIEIRQDLVADERGCAEWAGRVAEALKQVLPYIKH
ncbi:MAG: N-formylglutamate amidohydrolase [Rhodospirillaceae bacterium]